MTIYIKRKVKQAEELKVTQQPQNTTAWDRIQRQNQGTPQKPPSKFAPPKQMAVPEEV